MTQPPPSAASPSPLVHLCAKQDWVGAHRRGRLEPQSLAQVGFIHLSALEQVHIPANAFYRGRSDLLLLEVEAARVPADIVWEDGDPPHPDGIQFPHLYGPLPVTAVVGVRDYLPEPDGTFDCRTSLDGD